MKKLDVVRVVKQSCCCGHDRWTECQIIDEHTKGNVTLFLCYPVSGPSKTALWHCKSCLTVVKPYVEEQKDVVTD